MSGHKEDKKVITKKNVHALLWKGRNFELTNLWQRSIFLATFLVLIFTAYLGLWTVVLGRVQGGDTSISTTQYSHRNVLVVETSTKSNSDTSPALFLSNSKEFGAAFLILSLLGSSFSILWIFMAKGSKYWYERYEDSITALENDKELFSDEINQDWERERIEAKLQYREEEQIPIHGYLRKGKTNSFLFSTKGGAYSVSRVNILIGNVFFLFWFVTQAFHLNSMFFQYPFCYKLIWPLIIALVLNAILVFILSARSRSGGSGLAIMVPPILAGWCTRRKESMRQKLIIKWITKKLSKKKHVAYCELFESVNEDNGTNPEEQLNEKEVLARLRKVVGESGIDALYDDLERLKLLEMSLFRNVSKQIEGNKRKRREIEWIARTLARIDFGYYSQAFKPQIMHLFLRRRVPWRYVYCKVRKLRSKGQTAHLYGFIEEHVIAVAFPKAMKETWESNGRTVDFKSKSKELSARDLKEALMERWREQLQSIAPSSVPPAKDKLTKVRMFSDIPWGEINKEGELRVSTEDYSSWDTTFVLCEHGYEDTAICTETFQFRKNSEKGGADCLNSTIHWMDSNVEQKFSWNA